jgi:flagellar L-ring protein precursor FlgH
MKRRRRIHLAITAAVACGTPATIAAAAEQPASRAPQMPAGRSPAATQQPVRLPPPVTNETAAQYLRSGGSLFRASMASQQMVDTPEHARALRDPSYFAVPEPEPKTIRKHDLIAVVVREESSFSSQGSAELKRESSLDAKIDEIIKLKLANFAIQGAAQGLNPPSIKMSGNRQFKGDGTQERTDSMTARMTAEVVDVKPNGTLVLQARKTIKTDDEEQSFVLTGTCRVEDIVAADNSVLSTQLYDLRLEKNTKGTVRSATKRGVFGQVLDFINPF